MILIIAGSRGLELEPEEIDQTLVWPSVSDVTTLRCGCADGADISGYAWARARGKQVEFFPAWPRQREWALTMAKPDEVVHQCPGGAWKARGYLRNIYMATGLGDSGLPADAAMLYWDGTSHGTEHMHQVCLRRGIECNVAHIRKDRD